MKLIREKGIDIIIYEPIIRGDWFEGMQVVHDLSVFKQMSDVIVANRLMEEIADVKEKVFSRDIYARDIPACLLLPLFFHGVSPVERFL